MDTYSIPLCLNSSDPDNLPGATASSFIAKLPQDLVLDGYWEVALQSANIPRPLKTGNSIRIECDLVAPQIYGGRMANILWITPPVADGDDSPMHMFPQGPLIPWRRVQTPQTRLVECRLTESDGTPVPHHRVIKWRDHQYDDRLGGGWFPAEYEYRHHDAVVMARDEQFGNPDPVHTQLQMVLRKVK